MSDPSLPPRRVRLADLAAHLGCDKSTISLALQNSPKISVATRSRVQALARAMHYRPDAGFKRLATLRWAGRSRATIGNLVMLSNCRADYPVQRARIAESAAHAAEHLGYGLELLCMEDFREATLHRRLAAMGCVGILKMASPNRPRFPEFDWGRFSVVEVLAGVNPAGARWVVRPDEVTAMLDAGTRMIAAGVRSAGIVLIAQDPLSATDIRLSALALYVMQEWNARGIRTKPILHLPQASSRRSRALREWVGRRPPEGMICHNPTIGRMLAPHGIREGHDYSGIALHRNAMTNWAGFELRYDLMAQRAVQILDTLIRHDERGVAGAAETTVIASQWVDGPSFPLI